MQNVLTKKYRQDLHFSFALITLNTQNVDYGYRSERILFPFRIQY